MTKASVNFKNVTNVGHAITHTSRTISPTYLLEESKSLGTICVLDDAGQVSAVHKHKLALASSQALRSNNYSPVWEGILNLPRPDLSNPDFDAVGYKKHCTEITESWINEYQKMTGHKVLRADIHLDEGHIDEGEVLLNAHAHIISDRTNEKGKVIKLVPKQLKDLQTLTAQVTQLERGESAKNTKRKHIGHQQYKALAELGRLETQQQVGEVKKDLENVKASRDSLRKMVIADTPKINQLTSDLRAAEVEVSKKSARIARLAQLNDGYKKKRAELKASGVATQKEYQDLKIKHEADLAKLEKDLHTAQTEAAKVPKLQKQIDQLTPEAAKVPALEAQALELAQLKERIAASKARAAADAAARLKPVAIDDPRSAYHPDNIAKRQAQEAAAETTKPGVARPQAEQVTPRTTTEDQAEAQAAYRAKMHARAEARQPAPQQEAKVQKLAELASLPMSNQIQVFDFTLSKFTKIRQEKLNRVSVKLLKRQERRGKAVQAVFNSRPPEPTGMLAALKRGAYEKAMDALEPIYQRAKKLAKQAEQVTQKVSEAAKQAHSWAYAKLKKADPGLVQRVEAHRMDERMEASRRQLAEREAQKALKGPDKGVSR